MTPQQIVDALEAGTLVIPADYREILQAMATQINAGGGGGGWAVTGTTTLTGATIIDTDGNGLEFNGDVVIKNRVNDTDALSIVSTLNSEQTYLQAQNTTGDHNSSNLSLNTTDVIANANIYAEFNDSVKFAGIYISAEATEGIVLIEASDGIRVDDAITAYADNAAAVAAIGAGKLYYTDVAGEYLIKMSH